MKPFNFILKAMLIAFLSTSYVGFTQVNTGGTATTANHNKQVIGYITNWDAWKTAKAGVPAQGALTHLNIDYSKYTILNYSFFGVAKDGSLHSGDHRNKSIHQQGSVQEPKDIFFTDIYSSWDLHILFGEIDPIQYINEAAKKRAEAQGFKVALNGTTWEQPTWGLSGNLPVPLHKENGAPGLLALAKQKGVKVMASIGGWSMCKHFPEMAADPVKRAKFIDDCKKLIATGFDGIDLDWEYPGPYAGMNFTGTQADFANFELLVKELRQAIGPTKLITAAMSADPRKLNDFNWGALAKDMDYFNMMTYDMNGGWSNKAGHNAPVYAYDNAEVSFFNWKSTLDKLKEKGVPTAKICFGAPFYGRGVITKGNADLNAPTVKRAETVQPDGPITTCADYTNWPKNVYDGTPNYFFIKQKALQANSGWTRKWDAQAKVPYLVKGNYFLSYDDEESIAIKAQFINEEKLGGTIVWTVYGDLELGGAVTSFGTKLKRWSQVKSPLVNKMNEVFAQGGGMVNQAPKVQITSPATTSTHPVGQNIAVTVAASDVDGTVTAVELFNNGTSIGMKTSSPYSFDISNLAVGTYTLTAKATDDKNAVTTSEGVIVIVKDTGANAPPVVTITNPKSSASLTKNVAVLLTAEATDSDGTIQKVSFWANDTQLGEVTQSPFQWSWTPVKVGETTLKAIATDDKGSTGTSGLLKVTVVETSGPCSGVANWDASTAYQKGNTVKKDNQLYKAKWWTQNENPTTNSGTFQVWEKLGSCGGSNPDNQAPQIAITSPANNATIQQGTTVSVNCDASDSDGQVVKVVLFNGATKLGEKTKAPYTFEIKNIAAGSYSLTAEAEDNKGAKKRSSEVSFTVPGGGSSSCNGLPNYSAGTAYSKDQEVANEGNSYKCKIAGWCSSNAAWAYAPGKGAHWQDAWEKLGACSGGNEPPTVTITAPKNGATYDGGSTIDITISATDDESVAKVVLYQGTKELAVLTSAPYTYSLANADEASYVFKAVATDNKGSETTSAEVFVRKKSTGGTPQIPGKILVGYWHNFNNNSTIPKLREVSDAWDVICVAFAEPKAGSTADMQFNPFEIYQGNTQEFINDVALLKSKGKKVLISIGGANAKVELRTTEEKEAFVNSMKTIIQTYGFDGMDIDLEGSSLSLAGGDSDFRNPTTPKIKNLIQATRELKAAVGASNFVLSMAPETAYVQGAYGTYAGVYGAYLPVIHALRNDMDYIHVQHYNTGSMFGADGKIYQPATADFHVAMAEMLITGFKVAQTGLTFPGLRADQVAIGLPSSSKAAGSGYTSEAVVQQALDYLIKGKTYAGRTYTTKAAYPNFRGLMTWSINWDVAAGSGFSTSHRAYLDGLQESSKSTANDHKATVNLELYPNPVSDVLQIKGIQGSGALRILIADINGRKVMELAYSEVTPKQISIAHLNGGVYTVVVKTSTDVQTKKFIKLEN